LCEIERSWFERERERERKRECLMGIIRLMSRWGLFLGHGGDGPTHQRARLPALIL